MQGNGKSIIKINKYIRKISCIIVNEDSGIEKWKSVWM